MELCPSAKAVNMCVRDHDCTRYVQSGWFQMFMEREGYMTSEMVSEASLNGNIKLAHIGMWLKMTTMDETTEAAVMIANKACMDRREELIDAPLAATKPKSADTLSTFNAGNYLALRSSLGIDIS